MNVKNIVIIVVGVIAAIIVLKPSDYEIKNASPTGTNIVCFGDSLTYGIGASNGMDYPTQLSKMIGRPIINLGVSGDTTEMALDRIDEVLEWDPKIVMLTLGGNDLKNRISKDTAFRNLRTIIQTFQSRGALVVVGGLDIPFFGRGFDDAYEELVRDTGCVFVPNVLEDLFGDNAMMSDPIHPNSQGYSVMAGYFYDAVKNYL